ncbi:unnamed protein product [Penicillium nalgiovense]|uniref:Uncharacterized protein n=1 Tax=Penicillium nalgiovense TaxID=60175 RepID=A0A9W4HZ80_PENNA|nr:unnamed protein product [Penicillium nalgiovense]CAG7951828.1 unnamed protein product [Penicillium nalgiovense]CAG8118174.1 unnamed protein product [Penicillium nalgiovense]CAG8131919.1 unnamed protein product [Penicillium nalgiovense]CAG8134969.1 unnamed protein product [Penicillium nalgiovense]
MAVRAQVQHIQESSPWIDIYTNSATSPLRERSITQQLSLVTPHAHPEPKRWQEPGGWGSRHMNDNAPFTLWDRMNRQYRAPTRDEFEWIHKKFGNGKFLQSGWYICIETDNPPKPVPLTLGCMPVMFVRTGETFFEPFPEAPYPNPRLPDPCPDLNWPPMEFPSDADNVAFLKALEPLANVRAVMYLPSWTVVELEYGDGRVYEPQSLPGVIGGRTVLYHHLQSPFYETTKNFTQTRELDPSEHVTSFGPLPQDHYNYLQESFLSPGCRVESSYGLPGSRYESATSASSAGVKLRNLKGEEVLTIANHAFLFPGEVYHPYVHHENIGDVIDTRPELDIALVKMTPAVSANFRNTCYFQAEPPQALLEGTYLKQGSWAEVDGMSSGLLSLCAFARRYEKPMRPPGHPEIPFQQWQSYTLRAIWGVVNGPITDGVCGAPIVNCDDGAVTGFFHLYDGGRNCLSANIDDLVAEGWQIA